eukprot:3784501-Prymnesium_polylepis.2
MHARANVAEQLHVGVALLRGRRRDERGAYCEPAAVAPFETRQSDVQLLSKRERSCAPAEQQG